jgi:ribosomal protein S2
MQTLIGNTLKGTVSGLNATFNVVAIKDILGESIAILECVQYGTPLIRVNVCDIDKPVRA